MPRRLSSAIESSISCMGKKKYVLRWSGEKNKITRHKHVSVKVVPTTCEMHSSISTDVTLHPLTAKNATKEEEEKKETHLFQRIIF